MVELLELPCCFMEIPHVIKKAVFKIMQTYAPLFNYTPRNWLLRLFIVSAAIIIFF